MNYLWYNFKGSLDGGGRMAHLSFFSLFKPKEPGEKKTEKPVMIECPSCGRFFTKRGHEHEPLCRDCWKLEKAVGH
jgi:hypothetical protein